MVTVLIFERPPLTSAPGVANAVAICRQRERRPVQVDPAHLRDNAVSLAQVISTGKAGESRRLHRGGGLWSSGCWAR